MYYRFLVKAFNTFYSYHPLIPFCVDIHLPVGLPRVVDIHLPVGLPPVADEHLLEGLPTVADIYR
jgi:hypothetical protein